MTLRQTSALWLGQPPVGKREQILAAAQQVFAASGFHQTEVQAISDVTGISKATIYKFFRSKDNLLLEMVREVLNHLGALALKAMINDQQPLQRLLNIAQEFLRFGEANRDICLLILRDGGSCVADISQAYRQAMERLLPAIEPLFASARQQQQLGDTPTTVIVDAILSCLLGHFQSWFLLYNCEGSLLEKGMTSVGFLVEGFRASS